mmetsp:Transcript_346/g.733  ORF Transcript_346/g.733 Transcript_346/m.733 type:complete len:342 (+) Transcript_346:739-1764(+)
MSAASFLSVASSTNVMTWTRTPLICAKMSSKSLFAHFPSTLTLSTRFSQRVMAHFIWMEWDLVSLPSRLSPPRPSNPSSSSLSSSPSSSASSSSPKLPLPPVSMIFSRLFLLSLGLLSLFGECDESRGWLIWAFFGLVWGAASEKSQTLVNILPPCTTAPRRLRAIFVKLSLAPGRRSSTAMTRLTMQAPTTLSSASGSIPSLAPLLFTAIHLAASMQSSQLLARHSVMPEPTTLPSAKPITTPSTASAVSTTDPLSYRDFSGGGLCLGLKKRSKVFSTPSQIFLSLSASSLQLASSASESRSYSLAIFSRANLISCSFDRPERRIGSSISPMCSKLASLQ